MKTIFSFQLLLSIPWGNADQELPLLLNDYPEFAFVSEEQMRKIPVPLRIRIDDKGGVHILAWSESKRGDNGTASLYHVDNSGRLLGSTVLDMDYPHAHSWEILDYGLDSEGNCYLLEIMQSEKSGPRFNRLRMVNAGGSTHWARIGEVTEAAFNAEKLEGTYRHLIIKSQSGIYLPAENQLNSIAQYNLETGELSTVHKLDMVGSNYFMNDKDNIYTVTYIEEIRKRALCSFDVSTGSSKVVACDNDLYGLLALPIGVDNDNNFYAFQNSEIAKISFQGEIVWKLQIENLFVRSRDGAVFVSSSAPDSNQSWSVNVHVFDKDEAPTCLNFTIESDLSGNENPGWRLIHVDDQERYYIFGAESPGNAGSLLIFTADGKLEEIASPPPDLLPLESRLEAYSFWVVDQEGRIYLPVTDSEGFKIVLLTTR
jgi:hypothetical protein